MSLILRINFFKINMALKPRFRARKYRRRQTRRPRRTVRKVRTLTTLTRKVNTLTRRVAMGSTVHYCYRSSSGGIIADPYASINCCKYSDLFNAGAAGGPLFGSSSPDFDNINKILHHSFTLQFKIDIFNEPANVDYTLAMVSLKKKAHGLYDETTGALTITDGPHYRKVGGMVMLNKQLFNIHYYKRFTMGNNNIALTTINGVGDTTRTCFNDYVKIKPRKFITNPGVIGASGDIDTLNCDLDPTGQYYFLIFNNNSGVDFESPSIDFNQISKFISYS